MFFDSLENSYLFSLRIVRSIFLRTKKLRCVSNCANCRKLCLTKHSNQPQFFFQKNVKVVLACSRILKFAPVYIFPLTLNVKIVDRCPFIDMKR